MFVICLGQMLYIYTLRPGRPDPDRIVSITSVGQGSAIYEVLYGAGGATVPYVYRYFLMGVQQNDEIALQKTKDIEPFLVTQSTGAVRSVAGQLVKLRTLDTVYNFHNKAYLKIQGQLRMVSFELDAKLP